MRSLAFSRSQTLRFKIDFIDFFTSDCLFTCGVRFAQPQKNALSWIYFVLTPVVHKTSVFTSVLAYRSMPSVNPLGAIFDKSKLRLALNGTVHTPDKNSTADLRVALQLIFRIRFRRVVFHLSHTSCVRASARLVERKSAYALGIQIFVILQFFIAEKSAIKNCAWRDSNARPIP